MYLEVVLLLFISAACVIVQSAGPIVETSLGRLEGVETETSLNFLGIPYAQPPVDNLRWKSPVESDSWGSEVYAATAMKADCAQVGCTYALPAYLCPTQVSEDCLYLNIYTPRNVDSSSHLPVMVYIQGGAFIISGATAIYAGDIFVEKAGVILVTFPYRIGVFGFLVTNDGSERATGNFALQDQRMALEWVNKHIESFGGDPNKVTLFGQSAGAQSVAYHLTSSKSDALFHAAIIQSEPFSIATKTHDQAVTQGMSVAHVLGCSYYHDTLECLREKSWQELAIAAIQIQSAGFEGTTLQYEPWGPYIDNDDVKVSPLIAFMTGNFQSKPMIVGTVSEEGISFVMAAFRYPMEPEVYTVILHELFGEQGDLVYEKYPHSSASSADLRPQMIEIGTDFVFTCSNRAVVRSVDEIFHRYPNSKSPSVWHYVYDEPLPSDAWGLLTYCEEHVCHGAEISIIFPSTMPGENSLSEAMITYWSNFAKSGNPNINTDQNGERSLIWPRYGPAMKSMLFTGSGNSIAHSYNADICDFWDPIFVPM